MSQTSQDQRHGYRKRGDLEEFAGQTSRARARISCGFGCPCCGPRFPFVDQNVTCMASSEVSERNLASQAAAVDGSREASYVDTHVHLELVLQQVYWYKSASSLLEPVWDNLTDNEKRCWGVLGFTQNTWESGSGGSNPTWFTPWDDLSVAKRHAAASLGWSAGLWDAYEWILPYDQEWSLLDESTRAHLVVLGESQDSWDEQFGSKKPAGYARGGDMRTWWQLSEAEQSAATELGFWPDAWNMRTMASVDDYIQDFCGSGFDACVTIGCDGDSIEYCRTLALAHPKIFAAVGCHPKNAWLYEEDNLEERFFNVLKECGKKIVAWGECGLDYSNENWGDDEEYRNNQKHVFERQIQIAVEKNLPLVLHIRAASEDAIHMLQKFVPRHFKAHVHAFHGPDWFVSTVLEDFPNFVFGVTGTVSLMGDGTRIARLVPLERMVLETDGPYMTPRNTNFNHVGQIPLIGRLVAEIRGCDASDVLLKTRANSRFIYGI